MHAHHPGLVSLSLGALSLAGRSSARDHVHPVGADARVVWIGGRATDEDDRAVREALAEATPRPYRAVVDDVADRLFRRDLARLRAVADLGFFHAFYQAQARHVLERLDGVLIRVERGGAS